VFCGSWSLVNQIRQHNYGSKNRSWFGWILAQEMQDWETSYFGEHPSERNWVYKKGLYGEQVWKLTKSSSGCLSQFTEQFHFQQGQVLYYAHPSLSDLHQIVSIGYWATHKYYILGDVLQRKCLDKSFALYGSLIWYPMAITSVPPRKVEWRSVIQWKNRKLSSGLFHVMF